MGREWLLNRLSFTMPEASFVAKGTWAAIPGSGGGGRAEQRRTAMTFRLDINDAGILLGRFGMPGVLRRGNGRLEGNVDWRGSPFSIDYPSLGGQLGVNVESGQFLKADPGLAKPTSCLPASQTTVTSSASTRIASSSQRNQRCHSERRRAKPTTRRR